MALNFTGRPALPEPDEGRTTSRRLALPILALAALAILIALILFASAQRSPKPIAGPSPVLVGSAAAPASSAPPVEAKPAPAAVAPPQSGQAAPAQPTPRQRFIDVLRRAPGQITLMVEDDPQAEAYGRELKDLFETAGWTVGVSQAFGSGPPERGLAVALGSTPQDAAVRDAFAAAGLPIKGPPPADGLIQTPEIFVGPPLEPRP